MVEAAARELYTMCTDDGIPWTFCPIGRANTYRHMARRVLLAGLQAHPAAEVAA